MKQTFKFIFFSVLVVLIMIYLPLYTGSSKAAEALPVFKPTPNQDTYNGRNSHAYLPSTNMLTTQSREQFMKEIAQYALDAYEKWGIPASAIVGMAAIESGYGTTRISYYANNLFGIKVWGVNPANAWQLVGQPDEDFEKTIPVLADYGQDRKVFDESNRRDNWYRMFSSRKEAVEYLAGTLLLNSRYASARDRYQNRIKNGWSYEKASKEYVYDIAQAGYNHLGGDSYRKKVGAVMDQWKLYEYDQLVNNGYVFKDIHLHWAQKSIEQLAESKIISGFPDRTFRPEEKITREQFIKLLVEVTELKLEQEQTSSFQDIKDSHWSSPYIETAVSQNIVSPDEYGTYFRPEQSISRQEMAILSAKALALQPADLTLSFQDQYAIDNNSGMVGAAVNNKLLFGFEDQTFRPKETSTRAQAAVILTRILDFLAQQSQ